MARGKRAREGGFTLLEVILVVMLVGIISAVVVLRFPTIPKVGAATRRLVSDIRYAKELAIRLQTKSGIFFISNNSYRIFQNDDTNNATIDPVTGTDMNLTLSGRFSGATLNHNFAGNTLKFDSLGTPLDGNDNPVTAPDNTITVTDPAETRTVTVEPNTGKVTES